MGAYTARNGEGLHRIAEDDPIALQVLKDEHHKFRELFDAAKEAKSAALKTIGDELCLRLDVHMTIEEEILYPVGKKVGEADNVDEGIVEHAAGKELAGQIAQMDGTEELYASKIHVLGEQTIHHIDEEDEELFEELKEAHEKGEIDLNTIGEQLRARQADLYQKVEATGDVGPTQEADAEEVPAG